MKFVNEAINFDVSPVAMFCPELVEFSQKHFPKITRSFNNFLKFWQIWIWVRNHNRDTQGPIPRNFIDLLQKIQCTSCTLCIIFNFWYVSLRARLESLSLKDWWIFWKEKLLSLIRQDSMKRFERFSKVIRVLSLHIRVIGLKNPLPMIILQNPVQTLTKTSKYELKRFWYVIRMTSRPKD